MARYFGPAIAARPEWQVYLAVRRDTKERVAVKCLTPRTGEAKARRSLAPSLAGFRLRSWLPLYAVGRCHEIACARMVRVTAA